ncbi:MAG: hypothetical protein AMXMBFR47_44160 [Planctomycetota bacterium]
MRLTHTLEVTQVARTIARALRMNEDLTEAIALGHDVGHTPFGHAGEAQLHKFLQNQHCPPRHMRDAVDAAGIPTADFKHNFQSVRLLSTLEKYDSDGGLGLSLQTLEGILKHTRITPKHSRDRACRYPDHLGIFGRILEPTTHWTIEGQIVAVADEITHVAHDLADVVLYGKEATASEIIAREELAPIRNTKKGEKLCSLIKDLDHRSRPTIANHLASAILTYFISSTIECAKARLDGAAATIPAFQVWGAKLRPDPSEEFEAIQEYKDKLVVNCYEVNRMDNKGEYTIRQLLDAYVSDPRQLEDSAFQRYKLAVKGVDLAEGLKRTSTGIRDDAKRFTTEELQQFCRAVESTASGSLRQVKAATLEKVPYYLLFDLDWRRAIVDQIAMMTDSLAEREFRLLYGSS